MGWRFEHPGFGLTFRLDEHGGDAEGRHEQLYAECTGRIEAAIREIIRDPAYAELEPQTEDA